ncbi:MAG TPA: helix-turn-helix domain-containing protein [Candidatus Acidoferrales bacterium]|nr:helix-turn-helix domain-containing protein [Candidatus Acidoferrales bacterium]
MTHPVCDRFHSAVELIGARWSGEILRALFENHQRYCDIRSAVPGISDTMLAQRLRDLEERGLVQRWITAGHPVRVEYRLTEMSRELHPVLEAITAWSQKWIPLTGKPLAELATAPRLGTSPPRPEASAAHA